MIVRDDGYAVPLNGFEDQSLGGLWSKVKSAAKKVVKTAVAPLVVPTAAYAKGATWVASKTGIPGAKAVDRAVAEKWNSAAAKSLRSNYSTQLKVGAAVGATIVTGGSTASALATGLSTAVDAQAKKNVAENGIAVVPTAPAAPAAAGSGKVAPLVLAAGGFAVGGPPGAIIGGILGLVLGRKSS